MKPLVRLLCFLFAVLFAVEAQAASSLQEFAVAINQAGRQRMLSQKMTKDYLLMVLNVDAQQNSADLAKTIKLFDATLAKLLAGDAEVFMPKPPTEEIRSQLLKVKGIWEPFKAAVEKVQNGGAPSQDELKFVAAESLHLVGEMDKAVSLYEAASVAAGIKSTGAIVNVAGRQRMLSQRMAKDILLIALAIEPEASRADLKFCRDLFEKSLVGLLNGDASMNLGSTSNNRILKQLLQEVDLEWKEFAKIVDAVLASAEKPGEAVIKDVAQRNLKLLAGCQKVVSAAEASTF